MTSYVNAPLGSVPQEPNDATGKPIPFPPNFSFPFLRLPVEIRYKIYRLLFKSSLPVYPTIPYLNRRRRKNGWDKNGWEKPPPMVLLRTSFPTDFLRISKQVWTEASQVLWGENQIVFQFPLKWSEKEYWTLYTRSNTFVPAQYHLQRIRNLVIEVYLFRQSLTKTNVQFPARPTAAVKRELKSFGDRLGNEHHLQRVEIRFNNLKRHDSPNAILAFWPPLQHYSDHDQPYRYFEHQQCCFKRSRFSRRGPPEDVGEVLCRKAIDVDQQTLRPLTSLRGISKVAVIGRVTPEWAAHLKACLSADPGAVLEPFAQDVPA